VPAGVPEFWLNVLRNYEQIGEQVTGLYSPGGRALLTLLTVAFAMYTACRCSAS
jgi:hypothetical protein